MKGLVLGMPAAVAAPIAASETAVEKQRLIVLTNIENEPDALQSLVRQQYGKRGKLSAACRNSPFVAAGHCPCSAAAQSSSGIQISHPPDPVRGSNCGP